MCTILCKVAILALCLSQAFGGLTNDPQLALSTVVNLVQAHIRETCSMIDENIENNVDNVMFFLNSSIFGHADETRCLEGMEVIGNADMVRQTFDKCYMQSEVDAMYIKVIDLKASLRNFKTYASYCEGDEYEVMDCMWTIIEEPLGESIRLMYQSANILSKTNKCLNSVMAELKSSLGSLLDEYYECAKQ